MGRMAFLFSVKMIMSVEAGGSSRILSRLFWASMEALVKFSIKIALCPAKSGLSEAFLITRRASSMENSLAGVILITSGLVRSRSRLSSRKILSKILLSD